MLNEAQSAILNALEKQFGKVIYNNDPFVPTNEVMNQVFNILNKTLFSNQLPKIDVLCISENELQAIFNKYNYAQRKASDLYAVYFPLPDWSKINYIKKNQIPPIHYLAINITQNEPLNFAFAINSLCHEMIHYLDTIKGDILFRIYDAYNKKQDAGDEHLTPMFIKKMNQFNKEGMTIMPNGNDVPIKDLCQLSSYRMKKLEEMEKQLSEIDMVSKSNILDKVQINDDGTLGAIAF